jgi:hypothetical protein
MIKDWLDLPYFNPIDWTSFQNIESWWLHIVHAHPGRKKAVATPVKLVSWELWNEHNARIFKNMCSMVLVVFSRIKLDARSWILVGTKQLDYLLLVD